MQTTNIIPPDILNYFETDPNTGMYKVILRFENNSDNEDPSYASAQASGFDLRANVDPDILPEGVGHDGENFVIPSGKVVLIPTGIKLDIAEGYEVQIRPRSGTALKHGVTVLNSPGTIDCVTKGTKIKTPDGDKLVEDLFNSNKKEYIFSYDEKNDCHVIDYITDMWIVEDLNLFEIETEDGDIIKLPENKEVLTNTGWKKVINLTVDDKILRFD